LGEIFYTCVLNPFDVWCSLTQSTESTENAIKDLNVISKTLKILEKHIRVTLQDTGIGNDFLNETPLVQEIKVIQSN
jgi:fructose-1,6-bisphosphatase